MERSWTPKQLRERTGTDHTRIRNSRGGEKEQRKKAEEVRRNGGKQQRR